MRNRRLILLMGALLTLCTIPACPGLGNMLRAYGYTELRPPSTLLLPGAMVAVENKSPFEATLVCGPWASLGPDWHPQKSMTAGGSMKKFNGRNFEMGAEVLDSIRADARFKYISSVTVTLANPHLIEIRDEDILTHRDSRSAHCAEAIRRRTEKGFKVTMVKSGLIGDVTYAVRWSAEAKMSAKMKIDALQQLALELGGGAVCVDERLIRAKDLMWGIKDDAYMAALSVPEMDTRIVSHDTQYVDSKRAAYIPPKPDAPVVTPNPDRDDCLSGMCLPPAPHCDDCDESTKPHVPPIESKLPWDEKEHMRLEDWESKAQKMLSDMDAEERKSKRSSIYWDAVEHLEADVVKEAEDWVDGLIDGDDN